MISGTHHLKFIFASDAKLPLPSDVLKMLHQFAVASFP
jgi:hypothetical protein